MVLPKQLSECIAGKPVESERLMWKSEAEGSERKYARRDFPGEVPPPKKINGNSS